MEQFLGLYQNFINLFPGFLQPVVPFVLAGVLVYSVFQALRQNFLYLIVVVVLLPASLPILKQLLSILIDVINFLIK